MRTVYKRGFTLIELLVVIAIIGLLAAVVLGSLSTARSRGVDASVKSNMDSARAQMEIYAGNNGNSYYGGCAAAASANGLSAILTGAASSTGATVVTADGTAGAYNKVTCHDGAAGSTVWAAEAPLAGSASGAPIMWCVDSSGAAKQITTNIGASIRVCP